MRDGKPTCGMLVLAWNKVHSRYLDAFLDPLLNPITFHTTNSSDLQTCQGRLPCIES